MIYRLSNPPLLVIKAVIATLCALILDHILGNPDHVSSTFVAVLCISPTVVMGLKNAKEQFIGSLIGGVWGAGFLYLNHPLELTLPFAVGCAIGSVFLFKLRNAYPIAAFTALFMLVVPWGTPFETLKVRFLALSIAALSAFLVNVLISSMFYSSIFQRRYEKTKEIVWGILEPVLNGDFDQADSGFELLVNLQGQLSYTLTELRLRHSQDTLYDIQTLLTQTRRMQYLLHLILELGILFQEKNVSQDDIRDFINTMQHIGDIENTPLHEDIEIQNTQKRILITLGFFE